MKVITSLTSVYWFNNNVISYIFENGLYLICIALEANASVLLLKARSHSITGACMALETHLIHMRRPCLSLERL